MELINDKLLINVFPLIINFCNQLRSRLETSLTTVFETSLSPLKLLLLLLQQCLIIIILTINFFILETLAHFIEFFTFPPM